MQSIVVRGGALKVRHRPMATTDKANGSIIHAVAIDVRKCCKKIPMINAKAGGTSGILRIVVENKFFGYYFGYIVNAVFSVI